MKRKAKPDFSTLPRVPPVPHTAPMERELWSEQSRRSYYPALDFYKDIDYDCRICGIRAVFGAEEQKHAFEVKKKHIATRRVLCPACFNFARATASGIRACEAAWKADRRTLRHDAMFLSNWLDFMGQHKRFQPYQHNFAIETMVKKLLSAITATKQGG